MTLQSPKPILQLDGLLGHLSCSSGLYAKDTFLSLYSCITRIIRDYQQQMKGFVLTSTLNDDAFETMAVALENVPNVPLFKLDEAVISENTGFLLVLTNRISATLFWSAETNETFRMYDGGWTFHPGDTRTVMTHVIDRLQNPELQQLLNDTPEDRRYDEKVNVLLTSLVNGLENRNRQLTVALEQVKSLNDKVIQSERLAAIGQLSSVIAHEIRNPLGLIDLYAKLVEAQVEKLSVAGEDGAKLLKNVSQIRQATGGLETILSELTNYAKPLTLELQNADVQQLVMDVCEFYQPSYTQKGVTLNLPAAGDELILSIDVDRIRQALINLLKNALEASKEGAQVTVSVASRKRGDGSVYIKVADQGCGIAEPAAKKLFTPYFSTKSAGTGLGLAHSRKILQAHGGNVELLSSVPEPAADHGCIFAIILPRSQPVSSTES